VLQLVQVRKQLMLICMGMHLAAPAIVVQTAWYCVCTDACTVVSLCQSNAGCCYAPFCDAGFWLLPVI